VAKHDTKEDIWVVVEYDVYDLTKFIDIHPGGLKKILQRAGGDATKKFIEGNHPFNISSNKLSKWKVGHINPDSTIEMWQKEEQAGKMDAVWSIMLGVFMLSYMIYLTV
jgi:cytochrome b involved in lipid metabolism